MPSDESIESTLAEAGDLEKNYDWSGAAEFYKKGLNLVSEQDFSKLAQIHERLGYAFYRAAMQAENVDEFKERMHQSASYYENAKEFYERLEVQGKTPRMLRCDAMIAYVGYWSATEVPEKKRFLNECWRQAKESLKSFDQATNAFEYGKTYNQLASCVVFGFAFEWDFQTREKMMKEALELGGRAIKFLSTLGDSDELAKAYAKTAVFQDAFIQYFLNLDEQQKTREKALSNWQKAVKLSEEIALLELLSTTVQVDHENIGWDIGGDETLRNFNKALEHANQTKDKFVIGRALDWLAYHTTWKLMATENQDSAVELARTILQYAQEAKHHYTCVSFISARDDATWIESPHNGLYLVLAFMESNLKKRRELSEKALETAPDTLKKAEDSGYPEIIRYAHQIFSSALTKSAALEMNSDEKKKLLEKALVHGNEASRMTEQLEPFDYWDRGFFRFASSETRWELAELAKDNETEKNMLEQAASEAEDSLKLCAKHATYLERRGQVSMYAPLGAFQYQLGKMFNRLFESTYDKNHLRRATEAFAEATESFQKLKLTSRMAECYWKAAQTFDKLGEHLRAAESFELASNNYKAAAEKIPELKDFYQDHATYMQAWSEIEKARHDHVRQVYSSAEEHFNRAAILHKSLKQWSYLAPNYSAWTQVEHAEELSRKEQSEEAIQAFQQATRLFEETKKSLQAELDKIEDPDERQMANKMVTATDFRHKYCFGRIALEEAKTLDRKGEHYSSSEKYSLASKIFEKIAQELEAEQDRKEFRFITTLSQAWAKMTQAEAEESPNLYAEAAQLFEQAKELSPNEKARMLAQGHSRFCRALEAGTKFADTKDPLLQAAFVQNLENASNYYVKAGFRNASEYAKATELLFEAYTHLDSAKKETDPERKVKFYTMAEKVLQTSAGSFMKAEHPEKREQVLRLLENVKEEQELALSLTEVLHSPSIVSATTAFTTPTPTYETAVGLERFEHANVQANVTTRQKALKIGEDLDLDVELVNAGKGPALLIKLADAIPTGFELAGKPDTYRVEDSSLNMKGKKLDPLKIEEFRLVLKSFAKGMFRIQPKVIYLDETGHQMSCGLKPVNIEVSEIILPGRVTTGYRDLDNLLLGGIPKSYSVVLTSPSCNERDLLIRKFLEAGVRKGEVTFYVTLDPSGMKSLAEEYQSNFYLFICNPRADEIIENLPNVFKLKGVENLTEIGIALTSTLRRLDASPNGPKRSCIEIISDVLLQHHAVSTRRWLTSIIPEFRSRGFTTLAVMNPQMHSPQEAQAIPDLFEGEINIYERETEGELEKFLRIKKMYNKEYLDTELTLRKERLER